MVFKRKIYNFVENLIAMLTILLCTYIFGIIINASIFYLIEYKKYDMPFFLVFWLTIGSFISWLIIIIGYFCSQTNKKYNVYTDEANEWSFFIEMEDEEASNYEIYLNKLFHTIRFEQVNRERNITQYRVSTPRDEHRFKILLAIMNRSKVIHTIKSRPMVVYDVSKEDMIFIRKYKKWYTR